MSNKAQIIRCPNGHLFAACMEPLCYTDKEWLKDVREYYRRGCKIEMVDPQVVRVQIQHCDCDLKVVKPVESLPDQLELF